MNTLRYGLLVSILAVAACGDSSGTGGNGGSGDGGGGSSGETVTEQITAAEGGTVEDAAGDVTLTIPAGALAADAEITLAVRAATADTVTEVFEFGPADLELSSPATISIDIFEVSIPEGSRVVVGRKEGSSFVEVADSAYGGSGLVEAPITTLGTYSALLVDAPAGPCEASCMEQSGAVCCTACGCQGEVQCQPVCDSATPWDCEIGCCFDYDLLECAQ